MGYKQINNWFSGLFGGEVKSDLEVIGAPMPLLSTVSPDPGCWTAADGSLVSCRDGFAEVGYCPVDGPGALWCEQNLANVVPVVIGDPTATPFSPVRVGK